MTWRSEPYWICRDCGVVTAESDVLTADHPFDLNNATIRGCPVCREMEPDRACDVVDCQFMASGGAPTFSGYRWTCHQHRNVKESE